MSLHPIIFVTHMSLRQEALEAAISEKDAHLALLEVSGLRTARQADEAEQLRADRTRLTERLKLEVYTSDTGCNSKTY